MCERALMFMESFSKCCFVSLHWNDCRAQFLFINILVIKKFAASLAKILLTNCVKSQSTSFPMTDECRTLRNVRPLFDTWKWNIICVWIGMIHISRAHHELKLNSSSNIGFLWKIINFFYSFFVWYCIVCVLCILLSHSHISIEHTQFNGNCNWWPNEVNLIWKFVTIFYQ